MTTAWSHPAFERVAHIVGAQTGLSFESTRRTDAEAGIRRAMERVAVADVVHYLELLETGHVPLDDLVTELTVGETYFFREPGHFEFIRQNVFPEVLRRRGREHVLRLWSAGCATGEEAYSLAILLEEMALGGHVLATDISRAALKRARDAAYRRWSLRGLDDAFVHRFFQQTGDRWLLDARLGRHVTFQFHNLAQSAYPSLPAGIWGMDVILCRNVLIYFDTPSIGRVARGLHDVLADGGWLITGPSDPPLDGLAPFTAVMTNAGVFYRKGESTRRLSIPVREVQEPSSAGVISNASSPALSAPSAAQRATITSAFDPLAEAHEAYTAGHYERVVALTHEAHDSAGAVLHLRAVANAHGSEEAARRAQQIIQRHSLSAELHLLYAVLLLDLKRYTDAERALKRVLYLDRSLVIASYLLGATLRDQGRLEEARRAYRNARDLARAHPLDDELPFADGERAGAIVAIAEAEIALLDASRSVS